MKLSKTVGLWVENGWMEWMSEWLGVDRGHKLMWLDLVDLRVWVGSLDWSTASFVVGLIVNEKGILITGEWSKVATRYWLPIVRLNGKLNFFDWSNAIKEKWKTTPTTISTTMTWITIAIVIILITSHNFLLFYSAYFSKIYYLFANLYCHLSYKIINISLCLYKYDINYYIINGLFSLISFLFSNNFWIILYIYGNLPWKCFLILLLSFLIHNRWSLIDYSRKSVTLLYVLNVGEN